MIKGLDYWYDGQVRRFLEQVVRGFSGFQWMTGWTERDGVRVPPQLQMVNATVAQTDRQVAHIMKNNSENTLLSVPRITVHMTDLQLRRQDLQNTNHVDTRQVVEREFDEETGQYTGKRGKSYTVMRLMALPFEMTIQVDIWTSSQEQKLQLAEQILTAVAPDFAIQNSDNPLDWTAMTVCELTNINLTSQRIPIGTENEIDIMTLTFRLPFWLSPPAKVMQQNVIEQIVTNVHDGYAEDDIMAQDRMFQNITTPGNHAISVSKGVLTLLSKEGAERDEDGAPFSWEKLISLYNQPLRPTISKVRLKTSPEAIEDWDHDLIGTIQYDPSSPNRLIWTLDPDTLPVNTLPPIEGVINSLKRWPGNGLPPATRGQRYLIVNEQGGPSVAWGNLRAPENSIIEYGAGEWKLLFTPTRGTDTDRYVLNLSSGEQLRWNGEDWVKTIDGIYPPGYWRFML